MKLTEEIKRMLNALAQANAGENLTRRQKARALADAPAAPAPTAAHETVARRDTPRSQVGLYLGSELAPEIMQYVMQTCARLRHGLTVLSFQTEAEVEALLAPYREALAAAGIDVHLVELTGEPPAALVRALRRRPEVAFLVCNESGYFGHGLISQTQRQSAIPVPVVLVAANDGKASAAEPLPQVAKSRAA